MRFILFFGSLTPAYVASLGFAPPAFTGFAIIVTLTYYKYVNYLFPVYYSRWKRFVKAYSLDMSRHKDKG